MKEENRRLENEEENEGLETRKRDIERKKEDK